MSKKNEQKKEPEGEPVYREVLVFVNITGDIAIVGIAKTGEVAPFVDKDNVYAKIAKGIHKVIKPDVTIYCKFTLNDNDIINIETGEGSYKPYYLKTQGFSSNNSYIRPNPKTVPALDRVRKMLNTKLPSDVTPQMQIVLDNILINPKVTNTELQKILEIKRTRLYTLISQMVEIGIIEITGRGKNKKYKIKL